MLSCRHIREVTRRDSSWLTGIKATQCYLIDPPPPISFTKTGPVAIQDSCFFFLLFFLLLPSWAPDSIFGGTTAMNQLLEGAQLAKGWDKPLVCIISYTHYIRFTSVYMNNYFLFFIYKISWTNFLYTLLGSVCIWMDHLEDVKANLPNGSKDFPDNQVNIDCTELKCQTPLSPLLQSEMFSTYKPKWTDLTLMPISIIIYLWHIFL